MSSEAEKRLADHYSEGGTGTSADLRNSALISLIVPKVGGETVLDIGCGSGYLLSELVKIGKKVIGLEPNHELVALLRHRYPSITIIEKPIEKLNEIDQKFDTITLLDVLEHVEDDVEAIRVVHSKLEPNGRLVLVVPAHEIIYGSRDKAMGHYRRYDKRELVDTLIDAGFEIEESRHWNAVSVLPYWFAEKILHRELSVSYRADADAKGLKRLFRTAIAMWFRLVEHNINFGFGLSLIIVASRPKL